MSIVVNIHNKTYPSRTPGQDHIALTDIAFEIPKSQFTCIVGPSGCGKSTLLNIVCGLEKKFEGTISINGEGPEKAHIGYMFQTPRLMPWLSVLDNVRLVMDNPEEEEELARRLLEEMHLGDVLQAFPNRLSGGMQRRVALARAFVMQPSLLLMDEPFISLDEPAAIRLRKALLDLWSERPTTVLFVTHDLSEAIYLADRILFLSPGPGRIVLDYKVPLTRDREKLAKKDIEAHKSELLEKYPDLLTGLAEA
ncbi:MAG: ABC transporter ATP-binding protein [Rhodospirillaceae bacterium]|jgi:ABC-type nitrate/sulfonate/bicarbonate transport system ATPase subunit|nr:ABC transporter ATP-binding protein [Rhodospirillaceae bacterium]MBT5659377.1 ABC transporter ATP-binding protein [Rhodospirillaceae bacterium]MBT5752496.1 ABC transporter ATP-binding protein [Rhodospirillaceae bacterium]